MLTTAVIFDKPKQLSLASLELDAPGADDVVVDVHFSGISSGTERLLWEGRMPQFPGMGYPLVPGYEAVGAVAEAGSNTDFKRGDAVFVPGAKCYGDVRALFGATSKRLVTNALRAVRISATLDESAAALALAATAYHALQHGDRPDLIIGHGALGRLLARLAMIDGGTAPTVWEKQADRSNDDTGYRIVQPDHDERHDYTSIYDASGDAALIDTLVTRLGKGGEIVLAGFYPGDVSFAFAPAFMREARFRIAAEWQPEDMAAVIRLVDKGHLSLDGLITHVMPADKAAHAYETAFEDPGCLKMALDWRATQ